MKAVRIAIAAVIAAVITLAGATAAEAYPDVTVKITVENQRFTGGKVLKFSATAGDVDCDWVATFNGKKRTGSGTKFSGSFTTPKVSSVTEKDLVVSCTYEDGSTSEASNGSAVAGKAVASDTATITLLPVGVSDAVVDNGALPDTGGSNVLILIIGGVLVVVGGAAIYASRRNA